MHIYLKISVALANLLAAFAVIGAGRFYTDTLPSDMTTSLFNEHRALFLLSLGFLIGFLIAWRYNASFSVSAARMLISAVVGYLGISYAVDLLGNHHEIMWEIIGFAPASRDARLLTILRGHLSVYAVVISMAITSIAIGFESKDES